MIHSSRREEEFLRQAAEKYAQLEGEYLCRAAAREMEYLGTVPPKWDMICRTVMEEYCQRQWRKKRLKKILCAVGIVGAVAFVVVMMIACR